MMNMKRPRRWIRRLMWAAVACVAGAAGIAGACPIPVYQYSLENWPADPYCLTVYHDGAYTDDQRKALELLQAAAAGTPPGTNVVVQLVDVSKPDVARPAAAKTLPHLVVRYPAVHRVQTPVWEGPLTTAHVNALLDSPARRRIAELMIKRTSAVWVLLEGADRAANDAAEQMVKKELDRLVKTLVIPESAEWAGETVTIYNKVSFEIVRVRRDDPAEQMLVRMLIHSEPDLAEGPLSNQTMVFPIYGRGLVLYGLIGRGITAWNVSEAGQFLTGPCGCQVKQDNPGMDLLMAVDWPKHIRPLAPVAGGLPVGTGGFIQRMEEAERRLPDAPKKDE